MFCHKCGNQLPEGAVFCQKCGERVISEDVLQKTEEKSQINDSAAKQSIVGASVNSGDARMRSIQQKRKSKKLPIIVGIAVLIIFLAIIIILNWEGKIDYIATVRAHTPFASSQLPYTYEEVLNKFFDSLDWNVREDGDIHYVDISGKVKGMDSKFALTMRCPKIQIIRMRLL